MLCRLRKMVEIVTDTHSTPFIQPASGAPPPPVHASPYPPVDGPFNIHPTCPSVSYPLQPPKMESTDFASLLSKFSKLVLSLQEVLQLALVRQLKLMRVTLNPRTPLKLRHGSTASQYWARRWGWLASASPGMINCRSQIMCSPCI